MKKLAITGAVLLASYGLMVFAGVSLMSALQEADEGYFYE